MTPDLPKTFSIISSKFTTLSKKFTHFSKAMKKESRVVLLFFFLYLTQATNWYISPFGNNNNSGSSSTSPLADLKTALNKAAAGDTIYVGTGTYSGTNNIGLSISGMNVIGTSGSATTVFLGTSTTSSIFKLYS